jgi:exonuclease SbcC
MRLDREALRGVLCFANTLEIDFRELPAGLIAMVGENGVGKTTAMEAPLATVFRSFLSRDGALVDYALARDAFLETEFSLDGRGTYRAHVNLDGVKRGTDAVIEQILPDGTRRVLNDGKVTTFDQVVARTFPSRALLQASAIICQTRKGNLADLKIGERREVFAELIGLGHYQQMADMAKSAAGVVEAARGRLAAVRDALARETTPETENAIAGDDKRLGDEAAIQAAERERVQSLVAGVETDLAGVQEQAARYQAAIVKRDGARAEIGHLERDQQKGRADFDAEVHQYGSEANAANGRSTQALADLDAQAKDPAPLTRDLAAIAADLNRELAEIGRRVTNNRKVLQEADQIRKAATAKAEAEAELGAGRRRENAARDELAQFDRDRDALRAELHAVELKEADLRRAEQDVAALNAMPCEGKMIGCERCGGIRECGKCPALITAKAAEKRVPGLRAEVQRRAAIEEAQQENMRAVAAKRSDLADVQKQIATFEGEIADLAPKAGLLAAVETAEARITQLEEQRYQAVGRQAEQERMARARETTRLSELAERRARTETDARQAAALALDRHKQRIAGLTVHLADLDGRLAILKADVATAEAEAQETAAAAVRARGLEGELAAHRRRWDDAVAATARIEAQQADVARRRQELIARRAELAGIGSRIRALEAELLEWGLLAKALGKDGLQKLEIDIAGPTVSTYCNALMAECFGPRFTLELVTQEAKVGGGGLKETFSIHVYDGQRGGEARDIGDLSGGEKVIVAEALANAITLTVNARNEAPIRTFFRDETTGALDAENAARYVAMLRKVQQIGGFHQGIFITHNESAAALADAQLYFHDGAVDVLLPPYDRRQAAA